MNLNSVSNLRQPLFPITRPFWTNLNSTLIYFPIFLRTTTILHQNRRSFASYKIIINYYYRSWIFLMSWCIIAFGSRQDSCIISQCDFPTEGNYLVAIQLSDEYFRLIPNGISRHYRLRPLNDLPSAPDPRCPSTDLTLLLPLALILAVVLYEVPHRQHTPQVLPLHPAIHWASMKGVLRGACLPHQA